MDEKDRLSVETIERILKPILEGEASGMSFGEFARLVGMEPEKVSAALGKEELTGGIRGRCVSTIWIAVPDIVEALIVKARDGSLSHARLLLEVSEFLRRSRPEAPSAREEDEFERFSREELIEFIYGQECDGAGASPENP